jgi:hypothetical protein
LSKRDHGNYSLVGVKRGDSLDRSSNSSSNKQKMGEAIGANHCSPTTTYWIGVLFG